MGKKKKTSPNTIAQNRSARHEYFIEDNIEAGIKLQGWEVKSLRQKSASIAESYVYIKNGEAFISGMTIQPYENASTHVKCDTTRVRKLLMNKREIDQLTGKINQKGMTLVALSLYWKDGFAKLDVGLAKGKNSQDKRQTTKDRDWNRSKQRILKSAA